MTAATAATILSVLVASIAPAQQLAAQHRADAGRWWGT